MLVSPLVDANIFMYIEPEGASIEDIYSILLNRVAIYLITLSSPTYILLFALT